MPDVTGNTIPSVPNQDQASRPRLMHRLPTVAALAVLLLGLVSTSLVAHTEFKHAEQADAQRFDRLVERMQSEVERRLGMYRHGLMGSRATFSASNYVDREEFILMVESRDIDTEFPGALGIGYIQRVPDTAGEVQAFVDKVHQEGAPWFEITVPPGAAPLPGSLTTDRYIIKYIEPLVRNRSAHGLDIGSHPVRREAAERALRVNDAALTGTIQLVQDDQQVAGFLYLLPHYQPGMPLDTLEQRAEALVGWVYMPMLGPRVFRDIADEADSELDIDVFDGATLAGDALIYDADNHLAASSNADYTQADYADQKFYTTRQIPIGGRTWTLAISSTESFNYASRANGWTLLLGGGMLSLLLCTLVYTQGASTRRAWSIAEGMTADLRDYAHKAEQATKAKSDFLANMSHEIRTPMTAILGFTDLLRAQIDDDSRELLEHTQTIKRNGEHLLTVINDILDMSKIEAGKLDVEQIAVRTDQVLSDVLSLMRVKADQKNLALTASLTTPVPAVIQSDPVRLRQVLVNLVGNAIKFTDSGSVSVEVRYDDKMELLKFAVIDTGIGMTEEQVVKLFKAFEQADTTTTRQFGGTGLGLHISQRLARILGGQITCNSEYGQGSTFTLSIETGPLNDPEMLEPGPIHEVGDIERAKSHSASAQATADALLGNKPPLTGLRILLAEDGKDNQVLINHHLTKAGAQVTVVENGRLAVQQLSVNGDITGPLLDPPPFDLLLTDMQMPEMDGYTAVRLLRELGSTLPIVALTAHAMAEDGNKCIAAGCDYYASKPIEKQRLIDVCLEARQGRSVSI